MLGQVSKIWTIQKGFELYQMSKWLNIYQDFKWQNVLILSNWYCLILLISILTISISLQKNKALPESSLK